MDIGEARVVYKLGKLSRKFTSEEQIVIDNCDLAIKLLIPT